jgi:hypothetical protein
LSSVTKLTTVATSPIGASAKPLVAPITIMPRPKPVTVWKYVPSAITASSARSSSRSM